MYKYSTKDMYLMGQIYHSLLDILNPGGSNSYPSADTFPVKYILMVLPRVKASKIPKQVDAAIREIMDNIDPEDMEGLMSGKYPSPMDLRMNWVMGYARYKDLTDLSPITKLRKERGMSQTDLAEKIGVAQKDVSRWENKYSKPNAGNLKKLAEALECSMEDLV